MCLNLSDYYAIQKLGLFYTSSPQQPSVFSAKCGPEDLGNASAWFLQSFSNVSLFFKLETYVFATDSLICRQGLTWVLAENMLTLSLALSTSATDGSPFRPYYVDELNSNRRRDVAGVLFDNIDRFVLFFFNIWLIVFMNSQRYNGIQLMDDL